MFEQFKYPSRSNRYNAIQIFLDENPTFNSIGDHELRGNWLSYLQYIDPSFDLPQITLYDTINGAAQAKERLLKKEPKGRFYFDTLKRGQDAHINNLLNYNPNINNLMECTGFRTLLIVGLAQNWIYQNFINKKQSKFSWNENWDGIHEEYHALMRKWTNTLHTSENRQCSAIQRKINFENSVAAYFALGVVLFYNGYFPKYLKISRKSFHPADMIYLEILQKKNYKPRYLGRVMKAYHSLCEIENYDFFYLPGWSDITYYPTMILDLCKSSKDSENSKNIYHSLLQVEARGVAGDKEVNENWGAECPRCQNRYPPEELFYRIHYRALEFAECFECLRHSCFKMTIDEIKKID